MARRKIQPGGGKWENAVSPLQQARHERRWHQDTACKAIRQACPGHAGEACRLEASKLSEYENGRRKPSLVHIEAICIAYQRSPEDLGFINWRREPAPEPSEAAERDSGTDTEYSTGSSRTFGVYPDSDLESLALTLRGDELTQLDLSEREAEGSAAVQRKTFLKGVGAVAGAAATDPIIRLAQMDRAALSTTTVSKATLDELEQAAYLHARSYYELHLPGHIESLVTDWANAGRLLHVSQTPSQRIRLTESYARLSGVLGFYNYDSGHTQRALALFVSAEEAAREAGNNDLLAWLFERHAEVFNYGRSPRVRVVLAERGLEAAGKAETLTVARLHGVAAAAYALVGDRRWSMAHYQESERLLAKEEVGCWPSDHGMPRGFSFTPDAHLASTACVSLQLGEYAKAADSYRGSIAEKLKLGLPARTASSIPLNRVHLATALVGTGELEEATSLATQAVQDYEGVAMPLVIERARNFAGELTTADRSGTYARTFSEFLREHAPSSPAA